MITSGMLARQIILPRHSPGLNSFAPILLPPLEISCLSFFSAFPLFSTACSLFFQNTRGGGYLVRSFSSLRRLCALCVSALLFRFDFCRSFVFITLRIPFPACPPDSWRATPFLSQPCKLPGGVGAHIQEKNPWQTRVPLRPLSPFNAVFRHSMQGNTVQRNVWCRKAKFGRLD